MKKILLTVLAATSVSSFAGILPSSNKIQIPTKNFDAFVEQVSGDLTKLNDAQIAQNEEYARFNYNLVLKAKGNGKGLGTTFLNSYQAKAYPYLVQANKTVMSVNPSASLSEINQTIATAQSQLNQYQQTRQALFNDPAVQAEGYFIVNREANAFLCSLQNSEKDPSKKKKWLSFIVNSKTYADCLVSHEANTSKDLEQKAQVYASTMGATTSISNVLLSNAKYFTGDEFIGRVNTFVTNQTADTTTAINQGKQNAKDAAAQAVVDAKKSIDQNINAKTCNAAIDDFRASFADASQSNKKLRMITLASQPKSAVRTALNIFGGNTGNMIADSLNIAHVYITGTQVADTSKDYDVCSYATYQANKGKNVFAGKFINFDQIAAKTNGALSAEQAYQLFVIASAKSTEYVTADKNSGSNALFTK